MRYLPLAAFIFALPSFAQFQSSVSFTAAEIAEHQRGIHQIAETASSCLEADLKRHQEFFAKYGISAFYGDRSSFSKLSPAAKQAELKRLGKNPALLSEMQPTSCVGLAMKCLGKGFAAAGQTAIWNKVAAFTRANDLDGTATQLALQKLGWKVLLWNPMPSRNEAWDAREKAADPTNKLRLWGYHAYRYATVTGPRHLYYFNPVDDWTTLVDFGTNVPADFKKVPFFIGTAHTGYHVFPGSFGNVIEGHSMRAITDSQTIEASEFNPLKNGGGPRGEYRSGLMAIPPGY